MNGFISFFGNEVNSDRVAKQNYLQLKVKFSCLKMIFISHNIRIYAKKTCQKNSHFQIITPFDTNNKLKKNVCSSGCQDQKYFMHKSFPIRFKNNDEIHS